MNTEFHKLVQAQLLAKRRYGADSEANQKALSVCKEWQDNCHHAFRKHNRQLGAMCEHCNLPQVVVEEREYLDMIHA